MLMTIITASRTARLRLSHDCFVVVMDIIPPFEIVSYSSP